MKAICPHCGGHYEVDEPGSYECPQCNHTFTVEVPKKRIVVMRKTISSTPAPPPAPAPTKKSKLGLLFLLFALVVGIIGGSVAFFHIQGMRETRRLNIVKQASRVHYVASEALNDFKRLGYRSQYEFQEAYDVIQHRITQQLGLPDLYQKEVRPIVAQVCGILPRYREELSSSTGEAWACFSVRAYGGRGGGEVGPTIDVTPYIQKGQKIANTIIKPMRNKIEQQFADVLKDCETVIRNNSN